MPVYPYFFLVVTVAGWAGGLFSGPLYALLAYVFVYFNIPEQQWWGGYVPDLRWSFSSAVVLVLSVVFHYSKGIANPLQKGSGSWLLILYLLWMLITVPFAAFPDQAITRVYDFFRYVLIFCLVLAVVDSCNKLRAYLWMMLLQVGWLSWSARSYFTGERLDGVGPGDAGDANALGVLLLSAIPFLLVFLVRGRKLERIGALLLMPVILNCFAMTRSRGGFFGLAIALFLIFVFEKDKRIKRILVALSCSAMLLMFFLADQSFKDRLYKIADQDVQSESSGAGRVGIWKSGILMMPDYPLGAGGGGFMALSPRYLESDLLEKTVGVRASHNTLLLILVEQGVVGLILFFGFCYQIVRCAFVARKRLRDIISRAPAVGIASTRIELLYMLCGAFSSALAGVLTAGLFVDRLYFEGLYFLSALGPVLGVIAANELLKEQQLNAPQ